MPSATRDQAGLWVDVGDGERMPLREACDVKNQGTWWCGIHATGFRNNLEANGHDTEQCLMFWWCMIHGPEVP